MGDGGNRIGDGGCCPCLGLEGPELARDGSVAFGALPGTWVRNSEGTRLFPVPAGTSTGGLGGTRARVFLWGLEGADGSAGAGG